MDEKEGMLKSSRGIFTNNWGQGLQVLSTSRLGLIMDLARTSYGKLACVFLFSPEPSFRQVKRTSPFYPL